MKYTAAFMLVATLVSLADASGNLRASSITISQQMEGGREPLHLKGDRNLRILEAETSQDNQREATRDKYEKMKALSMPSYELTLKYEEEGDVTFESRPQDDVWHNTTDFGINIVGGEVSDIGEFPYFGMCFIFALSRGFR